MSLYLCLKEDATSVVSNDNPLSTKHSSSGEPQTIVAYVANDGKRNGVANDTIQQLIYTNLQVRIEGVSYTLGQSVTISTSDVNLTFDSTEGWNIGTIIKHGTERCRIEEIVSSTVARVQRNYTADGKVSVATAHQIGSLFIAESDTVALALPNPTDYSTPGIFKDGGVALTDGFDPTNLTNGIDNSESSTIIKSSNASVYTNKSIIQIDNEQMKILSISGNDITVMRGYNNTNRTAHSQNSTITCVGIVDIAPVTHKFFIKNDPPAGLPTQKKADIKIVLIADEEPL